MTVPAVLHKYVLYNFYTASQSELDTVSANFSRFRDYYNVDTHRTPKSGALFFILGNLVASAVNATLIIKGHPEYVKGKHGTVIFGLNIFDAYNRTLDKYWRYYFHDKKNQRKSKESPKFVKTQPTSFSFSYCSAPQWKDEKIWNVIIFAHSFDIWSWLLLVLGIIFVGYLKYPELSKEKTFSLRAPDIFSTLAVLITPGTLGTNLKPTKLFVLWMLVCVILSTYYTGELTSHMISPSPEIILSGAKDIKKNNYSLIYSDLGTFRIVSGNIGALNQAAFVPQEISIFARKVNQSTRYKNYNSFLDALTTTDKVAHLNMWSYAMSAANNGNQQLKTSGHYPKKRKCHVGKELVPPGELFNGFLPPGSATLAKSFQSLVEGGISPRWVHEYFYLTISRRVQDRVKIISPVVILEEVAPFEALQLEGKIATIFVLWFACLLVSFMSLCAEILKSMIYAHYKSPANADAVTIIVVSLPILF